MPVSIELFKKHGRKVQKPRGDSRIMEELRHNGRKEAINDVIFENKYGVKIRRILKRILQRRNIGNKLKSVKHLS